MIDTYTIYVEHQRKHNRAILSREEFYRQMETLPYVQPFGVRRSLDDLEIERGCRDDWGTLR